MARIISLIRYRFFLFAGIFPYLLGQIIAFKTKGDLNWSYFWRGFLGLGLVLAGVELFNEYFDAKVGGDRIFSKERPSIPGWFFWLGIFLFILALFIGLYFTFVCGWPVVLFFLWGFLAAYFYVGPPLRWAYRGLGEIVISLSYGPFMTLGSFYIQTGEVTLVPLMASLIAGLAMFSLTVINEVQDYYQDRLVGKKNLVVRFGKERAITMARITWISVFLLLALGLGWKVIPLLSLFAFLLLPFILNSLKIARTNLENPPLFMPAVRTSLLSYIILMFCLGIGYLGV